ncbi:hypothetical protein JTE90_016949 [Oedothorax gibbosus]|uniref:Uncharacterized protein n=1 Tax=Oedothorax gibbosus TaxID=931172 RepID=A0AAV6TLV9_9ARAC|nr:hypothetical protein JTE90_016949 [Oedothorax gibbosus]
MDFDMLIFEDNLGTVWMPPAIPVHDPRQQLPPQRQPAYGDPREYQMPPAFDYGSEPQQEALNLSKWQTFTQL